MAARRDKYGNLIEPEMPGVIDNTAVNKASQGITAAKGALDSMNYDNFKQGSVYQGLQQSYAQQGQQAMKDTLGQVAARTGGLASSYATTAANQSYNNYMRQLEDVARSMYNDEYSRARDKVNLAQDEYTRAYGQYRDSYSDAWKKYDADMQAYRYGIEDDRYNTDKEENRVYNDAYYGNALDYATYRANGGTLSEQAYNSIVASAQGKRTDANRTTTDTELEGIFSADGFLWGDWDGDGLVGENDPDGEVGPDGNEITFEDLYGGSSYGEAYWKAFAENAAQDRMDKETEENQISASEDVTATITNSERGTTLETIASDLGIENTDQAWKALTGHGMAYWQGKLDEHNSTKNDDYYTTNTGDISARIDNGETLDDIAAAYGIENTDEGWESITGKKKSHWERELNAYTETTHEDNIENVNSTITNSESNTTLDDIADELGIENTDEEWKEYTGHGMAYWQKQLNDHLGEKSTKTQADKSTKVTDKIAVATSGTTLSSIATALKITDTDDGWLSATGQTKDYWQKQLDDHLGEKSTKTQADNSADISARIANGETLEEIAADYEIKNTDEDWESITGMTKAQWEQKFNENTVKGYTYPRTAEGADNIVNLLANSGSLSLSSKNQGNFDHIFGDGAYNTVRSAVEDVIAIEQVPAVKYDPQQGGNRRTFNDEQVDETIDNIIDQLLQAIPEITMDQIVAILDAANPDAMRYYFAN